MTEVYGRVIQQGRQNFINFLKMNFIRKKKYNFSYVNSNLRFGFTNFNC